MLLSIVERFLRAQELIEKRHATWFIGWAAFVALVTLWGI